MKGHALQFVSCNTMELWEILPEFTDVTVLFQKFIDAMYKLYPGSDVEQRWLIVDMDKLVGETSRVGISSLTDLGKYHRDFITITMFLITKNCITTIEQSHTFTHGFPLELWSRICYHLQLKFPDHFTDNPYTLEQIHSAASFILHGAASFSPIIDDLCTPALTVTPVAKTKSTELSALIIS